jgi:hypothetical protein
LLIKELKKIDAKLTRLIPETRKIEEKKNVLDQSKAYKNLSKTWQYRENYEVYLKSIVEDQHAEV